MRIGTVTISKDTADRYFVSMQLGSDTPFVKKLAKTNSQVGVDLNTENFLTDSFGKVVANPRYYRTI
ncbi:transposase, partial [Ligilactobacillus salivarius]